MAITDCRSGASSERLLASRRLARRRGLLAICFVRRQGKSAVDLARQLLGLRSVAGLLDAGREPAEPGLGPQARALRSPQLARARSRRDLSRMRFVAATVRDYLRLALAGASRSLRVRSWTRRSVIAHEELSAHPDQTSVTRASVNALCERCAVIFAHNTLGVANRPCRRASRAR